MSERWDRYGEVAIASGRLLLADPSYVPDLLPQIKSVAQGGPADLREIAQVITVEAEDGSYPVSVLRNGGLITAARVDSAPDVLAKVAPLV